MSWERIRRFPARKFFGVLFGGLGGFFALAFLTRSLIAWRDVPNGVFAIIGLLWGGFSLYTASSSYEDRVRKNQEGGDRDVPHVPGDVP